MRMAADDGMPWISCLRWMHAGGMSGEGKTVPGPQATPPGEREVLADERERKADERARAVAAEVKMLQEQSRAVELRDIEKRFRDLNR